MLLSLPAVSKRWLAISAAITIGIGYIVFTSSQALAHPGNHTHEADAPVYVEVFEREDCQHCRDLKLFLSALQPKADPAFEVVYHDIRTEDGARAFEALTEKAHLSKATPIVLIGTRVIQGFDTPETTGTILLERIRGEVGQPYVGLDRYLALETGTTGEVTTGTCDETEGCTLPAEEPLLVRVPFLGVLDVSRYSLPTLAAVLGLIDGFNPCAMWVLVTFVLVLVQLRSRERLLAVAGLFIVAETVMYYLILNVWFTTWDFVGLDRFVTPLVGLLSIGGAGFFLYEWYASDGTCKVVNLEERAKLSGRIKRLATEPFTWLTALGVITLAFSVNIIEFACSIGIPQAFTKILEMNALSWVGTQSLMLIYIIGYMVDDFLVFGLALWGAEKLHLTSRYSRWSNLIGGLLMLLLGLMLLFAPEWLRLL